MLSRGADLRPIGPKSSARRNMRQQDSYYITGLPHKNWRDLLLTANRRQTIETDRQVAGHASGEGCRS
jgi:hypothetical protein